jgi:hypothetical protein
MSSARKQPWIGTPAFDSVFILLPPFIALAAVILLPEEMRSGPAIPLAGWVILVLLIDVSHVYSTLFRTYFDRGRFSQQKTLFQVVPVVCYFAGVVLYSIDDMLFWRALAYLAVFHFIRQQYGFMRLYARYESQSRFGRRLDAVTIYAATLYPIIYWHCSPGRNFTWFMEGDFVGVDSGPAALIATGIYAAILALYIIKESGLVYRQRKFNILRNGIIAGTVLSWYFGIVYFNGDLAFTLLNVVSHGIPYMALVWIMARKSAPQDPAKSFSRVLLRNYGIVVFVGIMAGLAYLEEGLWDGFVWQEHGAVFPGFDRLPPLRGKETLALIVPLLSLPQSVHYVLDGFIWRRKDG